MLGRCCYGRAMTRIALSVLAVALISTSGCFVQSEPAPARPVARAPEPAPAPTPPPPAPSSEPAPPPAQAWDPTGWELLGETIVQGKHDRDEVKVGKKEGRFRRIAIVVLDSQLEMFDVVVKLGNGEKFSPDTRLIFDESSRSRAIDLPGEARFIKKVEFRYGNLPGGGKARVQLWAKPDVAAPSPAPVDTAGWAELGHAVVEGKHDKDVIEVGKREGKFVKIMILVEDSDLELFDLVVEFGNGQKFAPETRYTFDQGSRSRAIDLPGQARFIKKVTFRYGNLPGGGKARVRLLAK